MPDLLFAPVSERQIRLAGKIAVTLLALAVLHWLTAPLFRDAGFRFMKIYTGGVGAIATLAAAYVLLIFMNVLNFRVEFHGANAALLVAVVFYLVEGAASALRFLSGVAGGTFWANLPALLYFLPPALQIVLAVQLLRGLDDLFGLLKPFAYTLIAGALLTATGSVLRGTPLAFVGSVGLAATLASRVVLVVILFRAADSAEPEMPS
jgi:hypothetical protein